MKADDFRIFEIKLQQVDWYYQYVESGWQRLSDIFDSAWRMKVELCSKYSPDEVNALWNKYADPEHKIR